jgi:hypothetical protein
MFANNYISTIVENQLPDFVRSEHPKFVALLKKYYEYMEQDGKTLNLGKNLYDYADVDTTRSDLIKYFKSKIIPNFPEETELSTAKLIKAARDFYDKKGTPDSFKFLFRALYNQDIDVYFPKEDILKASDGKWKQPQALRLAFSDTLTLVANGNVNVFAVSANTITSNNINFVSASINVNSYIQIGTEKRKVTNVNASTIIVEIPFANTGNAQTYDSAKLYKVTLSEYASFNVNLLEKKLGVGEVSRTTCVIEKAVQTVDSQTGREIVELYVSNVRRLFDAGENLVVKYTEDGIEKTFKSKIISLISNLSLYRNRFGVVQTGRRYKTGDPVVFYGGLADTPDATEAVAVVNNVSTGSIESITVTKPGYYYSTFDNSFIRVLSTSGVGANVVIDSIWDDVPANAEIFAFNTDALVYKKDILLNALEYDFDNVTNYVNVITGAGNTVNTVNLNTASYVASNVNNYYKSFILQIISGTGAANSPNSAQILSYNGTSKIATLSTNLAVAPDNTSNVKIYANAQTEIGRAMTFDNVLLGRIRLVDLLDGGAAFEEPPTFDTETTYQTDYTLDQGYLSIPTGNFSSYNKTGLPYPSIRLRSDGPYSSANGFYTGCRLFLDPGDTAHYAKVVDYVVTNPGTSANVKTLYLDRAFENNINAINILGFRLFLDFRPSVRTIGKIGIINVKKGGSGYNTGDFLEFIGTGYGANATLTVSGGAITSVNLTSRGEGYSAMPSVRVLAANGSISAGANAEFEVLGLSSGEEITAETSDIGRIQDFRIINRGFDYANTPLVSLKVVDILTDNLPAATVVLTGDTVWQGNTTNTSATFQGVVDASYRPDTVNTVIRVFNYSGTINTSAALRVNTTSGNISVNVSTQNAVVSFADIYDAAERKYPFYYGNGLAKANAEFLRGLIKYDGFYLNTDGFPSSDKKLQNKDYYHNYSYELSTEKSLDDYKETIYRVAHPAGMQLLSKYLLKNEIDDDLTISSNISTSNTSQSTNANTSYASNVLYGNSSFFVSKPGEPGPRANVGDLIVINTTETASLKQYTRVIANVVSNDVIWLESAIGGVGDGRLRITTGNANVRVYSNTSAITESLEANDNISFNISGTVYRKSIVSITGNLIQLNTSTGLANANVLYLKTPIYNVVAYKIIRTNS